MTMTNSASATTFSMPSDNEIAITRMFGAPRRLIFEAHTNPVHVQRWLLGPEGWTMPVCEIDLRPGGIWRYVWRRSDGSEMEMSGVYQEIVPHERLVCTERWGVEWPETLNTLLLDEQGGKTTLTQRIRYPSKEARDAAFATGMSDGATVSYERLADYLATLS
jgi:uncharacterized protein YndB with AHSA1/START domain